MSYLDRIKKHTLADMIYNTTSIDKIVSIEEKQNKLIVKGYTQNQPIEFEVKM